MPEPSINIRRIGENDLSEWLRLRRILWDETEESEHRREMAEILGHPDSQLVLAAAINDGGEQHLAGFLEASIRPFVEDCHTDHVGYLEGWFVEPEFRRHGIGRLLVANAEDWARHQGCTEMASDTEVDNKVSLAAHQAFGYDISSKLIHLRKDLD
jgi:aminoglycoside 6'-N-acetyltransferase I